MTSFESQPETTATNVQGLVAVDRIDDDLFFGTHEEIAHDNAEWDEIVACTSPEKLKALSRMFDEEIKRAGIMPLDFTAK